MLNVWLEAVTLLAMATIAPPNNSAVALFLLPHEYLKQQYTKGPSPHADYVFIAGERIRIRLEFWNESAEPVRLNARNLPSGELATVVLVRKQANSIEEVPVPFRLSIDPEAYVRVPGQRLPGSWSDIVELPRSGSLVVPLDVLSAATQAPGTYELRVAGISVTCEPDCSVRNQGGQFRFEVRDASDLSARAELLTRRAWSAIAHSRATEAETAVTQLLAVHPQSVFGYQLRGELAEGRSDWAAAASAYRTALRILLQKEDHLYGAARPGDVQDRIEGLRIRLTTVGRRERP